MKKIHAWMTEDGRVIPADSRDDMPRTVRDTYCIPLGKIAASASAEPDLHAQIMNIRCQLPKMYGINERIAYQQGHRDARHAAAELANAPRPIEAPDNSQPVIADTAKPYERHDPDNATAPFLSFIPDAKRDELIGALLASLERNADRETDFYTVRSFIGGLGLLAAQFAPQGVIADRAATKPDDDKAWKLLMLSAASKSGDPKVIELAAQLVGAVPCKVCGFVNSHCRCTASPAIDAAPDNSQADLPCPTCGGEVAKRFNSLKDDNSQAVALSAEPSMRDRARWFVRDFSRDVGFAMSDAQQEIMLNLFLKHATPSAENRPAQGDVRTPRYDEWRYLREHGQWSNGVPEWARDYSGSMNDFTAATAVIEELAAIASQSAKEPL